MLRLVVLLRHGAVLRVLELLHMCVLCYCCFLAASVAGLVLCYVWCCSTFDAVVLLTLRCVCVADGR